MGITNLPKPGIGFKATLGPGSFQRKLSNATRYGGLKNLRDNQKAIVDVVKKYQGVIRIKGGLSRLQQLSAKRETMAKDKTITKEDKREIKELFKHLGRGGADVKKSAVGGGKSFKVGGVEKYLTEKQVKRNLKVKQRDESGLTGKRYKTFAGNTVLTKSIGISDANKETGEIGAGRIGINNGPIGFIGGQPDKSKKGQAVNFNASGRLPNNSLTKIPLGGNRPIGL